MYFIIKTQLSRLSDENKIIFFYNGGCRWWCRKAMCH